jgi:hypothetical protein
MATKTSKVASAGRSPKNELGSLEGVARLPGRVGCVHRHGSSDCLFHVGSR